MVRRSLTALFVLPALLLCSGVAAGFALFFPSGIRWPSGAIVMHLQLGTPGQALTDGAADWGDSAEAALALWNPHMASGQFQVVRRSTAAIGERNGVNNVFFDDMIYGDRFEANTLAVTISWRAASRIVESDVIFNTGKSFDSYRGSLRRAVDFRRVAVHEFGHVLGLGHPDEEGQSHVAVMNSIVSSVEVPQADDTAGVQSLYGNPAPAAPPPAPAPTGPGNASAGDFPPRNESLDFRQRLETKYRDGLRRAPTSSFVDIEGSVVWLQEYVRYRINRCEHMDAATRVFMQIDGFGVQPVCGSAGPVPAFPARNESLDFRQRLEGKYRDGLRRNASATSVDIEGDVVWTQEYLRYRLGRCSHQQAVDRVMGQIDGFGAPPTCG
jgi:hypothetical protein